MQGVGRGGLWCLSLALFACSGPPAVDDAVDDADACVYCEDGKADAFGIARESYLAYGIIALANEASERVLDDDVRLDARAARGIVAQRPFAFIEEIDTVPYVGKIAFGRLAEYAQANGFVPSCGDGGLEPLLEFCDDGNLDDGDGCSSTCTVEAPAGQPEVHGVSQPSYLAYGILKLANEASERVLDDEVRLDGRAARGLVAQRPFSTLEELDAVSFVGASAFRRLADYARNHDFVPRCGDGGLESQLEACDDGNLDNGDGCSSTCQREGAAPTGPTVAEVLAADRNVILGAEIDVPLVDPGTFYLRERVWRGRGFSSDINRIFERADGIIANEEANERVSFDELAILSRSPFFDSLLPNERAALSDVWALFAISDAAPILASGLRTLTPKTLQVSQTLERPGPLIVRPRTFDSVSTERPHRELMTRIQQLPECNLDADAETLELTDVDKVLADFEPVFTRDEIEWLRQIRPSFFEGVTEIESGGLFEATFDTIPFQEREDQVLVEFDDYRLLLTHHHHLQYEVRESLRFGNDALLRAWSMERGDVEHRGESTAGCTFTCKHALGDSSRIRFVSLDDARHERLSGLVLLERYESGVRVYNRLVRWSDPVEAPVVQEQDLTVFVGATPRTPDGKRYVPVRDDALEAQLSSLTPYRLEETTSPVDGTLDVLLPESREVLRGLLLPGRYEAFEGIVLDVHASGTLVAHEGDSCTRVLAPGRLDPNSFWDGNLVGEQDIRMCSGRTVLIGAEEHERRRVILYVVDEGGGRAQTTDVRGEGSKSIELDTSFYKVVHAMR